MMKFIEGDRFQNILQFFGIISHNNLEFSLLQNSFSNARSHLLLKKSDR
ncbi:MULTISPECIES: hypothetical protein [Spirulina sp. CCY15215]|nr:hypothetical protein [Spirulina major]